MSNQEQRRRPDCELCCQPGGALLWSQDQWRVVRVDDAQFPGFYRLVASGHVSEFSQLARADQMQCMELLAWVEALMIQHLAPTKINLASLGNVVPHLHWHLVARFDWDSHFPSPIWASPQREPNSELLARVRLALPALDTALARGAKMEA